MEFSYFQTNVYSIKKKTATLSQYYQNKSNYKFNLA